VSSHTSSKVPLAFFVLAHQHANILSSGSYSAISSSKRNSDGYPGNPRVEKLSKY
ncbi:hypothetical protein HAX54_013614, partial [Datura stramonium]|nr:hypothetical protein [Datura stramonium]